MSSADALEKKLQIHHHLLNVGLSLTDEDQHHAGSSIMLHLPDPVGHGLECCATRDVVGHHGPVGAAVIALSDGAETLLSCRVPHLHLQQAPTQGHRSVT